MLHLRERRRCTISQSSSSPAPGGTGNESESLANQAVTGFSWQVLASIVRFGSRFAIGIVLARLLPPEDFGIVGIAIIATGFASTFADLGLGPALIQKETITDRHVRICHTLSFAASVAMTAVLYLVAGVVASFFQEPRVEDVLQVLSFNFVLSGFSITSNALMTRRLQFKTLVLVQIASVIMGYGCVSVALAHSGFGYWSLVYGMLAQTGLSSFLTYAAERHSLVPSISRKEFNELFRFSMGMSVASTVNYFARQGDYFVIGRLMNATSLGLYTRAFALMELPHLFIGSALSRVLFPAAARLQGSAARFKTAYVSTVSISVAVALPLSISVAVLAPELITTLYGQNWLPTIPLVQVLSLFGMFRMTFNVAGAFVRAKGYAFRIVLCQVFYAVMVVGGSWLGATIAGLSGVAWAVGVALVLFWIVIIHNANMAAEVSWRTFLVSMRGVLGVAVLASLVPFLIVCALRLLVDLDFVVLILGTVAYGFTTIWSLNVEAARTKYSKGAKIMTYVSKVDLITRFMHRRLDKTQ